MAAADLWTAAEREKSIVPHSERPTRYVIDSHKAYNTVSALIAALGNILELAVPTCAADREEVNEARGLLESLR